MSKTNIVIEDEDEADVGDPRSLAWSLGENAHRNTSLNLEIDPVAEGDMGPFVSYSTEPSAVSTRCGNPGCSEKDSKLRCSRCKGISYCSPACQAQHWKMSGLMSHKQVCGAKKLQAACHFLFHSIKNLDVGAVSQICQSGMDVNLRCSRWGWSPLICCAGVTCSSPLSDHIFNMQKIEIARILLSAGARPNMRINPGNGSTALHVACVTNSCLDIVNVLLEAPDIDVNIRKTSSGVTSLHLVCGSGMDGMEKPELENRAAIAKALLAKGADPNIHSHEYASPLMYAASVGNVLVLRALLEGGANATYIDDMGNDAFYYAQLQGHQECATILLEHVHALMEAGQVADDDEEEEEDSGGASSDVEDDNGGFAGA